MIAALEAGLENCSSPPASIDATVGHGRAESISFAKCQSQQLTDFNPLLDCFRKLDTICFCWAVVHTLVSAAFVQCVIFANPSRLHRPSIHSPRLTSAMDGPNMGRVDGGVLRLFLWLTRTLSPRLLQRGSG